MFDIPSLKSYTRYGMPAADQVLFNRHYALGYSYHFRQAKWALEIIDKNDQGERKDVFRPDYRIPEMFRADKADYLNSGFDRGHLVASENQIAGQLQNSETFLLSNMTPQIREFNQQIWKRLEEAVRKLARTEDNLETYVISGPLFDFTKPVKLIGSTDDNGVTLPIPHAYFKSVLTENHRGTIRMWSFMMPHEESDKDLEEFRVPTTKVEQYAGILLWERLVGTKMEKIKNRRSAMWAL